MKPKYIFSAVFAICLLMGSLLPRLSHPQPLAQAGAVQATAVLPIAPTQVESQATSTAVSAPTVQAQPTQAPTRALAAQPAPATLVEPVIAAPNESVPVKTAPPGSAPLAADLPDVDTFTHSVANGQADQVVGVYAPQLFALPVVQQPAGESQFVSSADKTVTQYALPAQYGVIALLAHNTLSGLEFFGLKVGQAVILIYGDGHRVRYTLTGSQRYQALSPDDPHSDFVDLNGPGGQVMNYQQLFDQIYTHAGQLVFQTCFEANGNLSWGRVFYTADPAS